MPVIAFETATLAGSVAIAGENGLISEIVLNIKAVHSEKIMPAAEYLMKDAGLSMNDMDAVAVSSGPGSFTGLRIGMSTAKGLSYASGRPVIGIPTLDALVRNLSISQHMVCPILDARKGEVYTALYRPGDAGLERITDDMALSPSTLMDMIREKTIFLGDGVAVYGGMLRDGLGDNYLEAPMPLLLPRASNVAHLAMKRLQEGSVDDGFTLLPAYVRKSEAELKFKG